MQLSFSSEKDEEKILKSFYNLLNKNILLTLSTVNKNEPYSNTAYYIFDKNFNLYIWSEISSKHCQNIKKNNKIAVNIFNSNQTMGSLRQGIQALGRAYIVNNKELIKAGFLYIKRFPKIIKFAKTPKDFHKKVFASKIYKLELNKIKIFDEKTFGEYEYREINVKRG